LEAACVGLKDPLYGEVLAAFLRGDRDNTDVKDEEVREWVRLKLCGYLGIFFEALGRKRVCERTLTIGNSSSKIHILD
jgi:hypothetical protein